MVVSKQAQIEVAKETAELWEGLAKIVEKIGEAKKLGLDTGAAVALVASGSIEPLLTAFQGMDQVPAEHKEMVPQAIAAHGYGAALVASAIAKALA